MLVKAETIVGLERLDPASWRMFAAGCAERMAQMFTAACGLADVRSHDVEVLVSSLDGLWAGESTKFYRHMLSEVERFEEFEPSEEGKSDPVELYSTYSALAMRYALICAVGDDLGSALKCGHIALTAMGQMDGAVPSNSFMTEEYQFQDRIEFDRDDRIVLEDVRQKCQAVARRRMEALLLRVQRR